MDNTDTLIQLLEHPLNTLNDQPMLYLVKAGDTLSNIISKHYNISYQDPRYEVAQASILYFNDSITDPNEIFSGQLLRLMPLADSNSIAYCPVPEGFHKERRAPVTTRHRLEPMNKDYVNNIKHHIPTNPQEREAFWVMAILAEHHGWLTRPAGAGITAGGVIMGQQNNTLLMDVKRLWEQYQKGMISQNQYNTGRQRALKTYANRVGPFEKWLMKGKTTQETIRISRSKAIPATRNIEFHAQRLNRLAKLTKYGGVALTGASLGLSCYQIANTQDRHKKNEIFVESAASTITGGAITVAISVVLISNPVGWGAALLIGGATALGTWGAGKIAKEGYNRLGEKIDLVSDFGVDKLCK